MPETSDQKSRALPPGTPVWMTVELVEWTIQVWSVQYQKPVTVEEAIEILGNAGRLMTALTKQL